MSMGQVEFERQNVAEKSREKEEKRKREEEKDQQLVAHRGRRLGREPAPRCQVYLGVERSYSMY